MIKIRYSIILLIIILSTFSHTTRAISLNLKLPLSPDSLWTITQSYNGYGSEIKTHIGKDLYALDFSLPGEQDFNKPALAIENGIVRHTGFQDPNDPTKGYGIYIDIEHENNLISRYAHLKESLVTIGEHVVTGQEIGRIDSTGNSTGSHLHFAMYQKQPDGTIVAYKPEPISGYTDLVAGMTLQSDNVLVQDTGMFSIFANAVHAMTGIFTSSPPPEEPALETTPTEIVQQKIPPQAEVSLPGSETSAVPVNRDITNVAEVLLPGLSINGIPAPSPTSTRPSAQDPTPTEATTSPITFAVQRVVDMTSASPTQSPSPSKQDNTVITDTTPPNLTFSISQCNQSLSADGCLIATTTITINLASSASDFAYYTITCTTNGTSCANFPTATTTATTTLYTAPNDNTTYTFSAQATDTNHNISTAQTQTANIATRPLVINEVAWAGTSAARDQDEWMELYNPTSKSITLTNWVLRSQTDNTPYVKLSGTISAKGFFLLERTDDTTISDITANQIYTGSLVNTGEILELSYASSTIDTTPDISGCGGWCAGAASGSYYSMERYDPLSSGSDASNWSNWQGFLGNGKNADGLALNGTPGKRNSVNYLVSKTGALTQNKTLDSSNSPYLIGNGFGITSGATLTVNAGTVIKFLNSNASLTVQGTLLAQGDSTNPVVFTSFLDDTYGGDMNADGTTTTPQSGDWSGIIFDTDSGASAFDNTILRYAGSHISLVNPKAGLQIQNTSIAIRNATIEKNYTIGVWFKNSPATTISNSIIRDHSGSGETFYGILLTSSSTATITNTIFQNNDINIGTTSASSFTDGGGNTPNPL